MRSPGALAAGLLALLAVRAVASTASWAEAGWAAAFVLAWVLLPGFALWRVVRTRATDPVGDLAMAGALGAALLVLGFVGLRELRLLRVLVAWPILALPLAWLAWRRDGVAGDDAPPTRGPALVLLGLCVLLLLIGTAHAPPAAWWFLNDDDLFHAGNAAEVLRAPPLRNPRISGLPLNYHVFSYALPAGLSLVSGLPVARTILSLLAGLAPALLALLVHANARELGRSAWAGVAAAGLLALHADLGSAYRTLGVPGAEHWRFASYLWIGVARAGPTALGLAFTAALLLLLQHRLAEGRGARTLAAMGLVGFVAAGTKGSVMPVVVAGLGAAWLVGHLRGRVAAGLGSAVLVLALVSAPASLLLAFGAQSYAPAMFHLEPLAALARSGFGTALGGPAPGPGRRLLLFVPWLAGYLGPSGWLALAWLARRPLGAAESALAGIAAAGLGAAVVFAAPHYSELFFAYTGQVGLLVLAGCALAGPRALAPRARVALLVLALPFLVAGAVRIWSSGHGRPQEPPRLASWREGMDWLRRHSEPEAVVASRDGSMLVSVLAERRSLFDSGRYTPQESAGGGTQAFARQVALRERIYAAPDEVTLAGVRTLAPDAPAVYVVCDAAGLADAPGSQRLLRVRPPGECPALAAAPFFTPAFANDVMVIYRAPLTRAR